MNKKICFILCVICTVCVFIVGCEGSTTTTTEVNSDKNIESPQSTTVSGSTVQESQSSDNNLQKVDVSVDDGNTITVYTGNPDIEEIEEKPYYSGVSEVLSDFVEAFVSCRYDDAKKKCAPNSAAYKLVESSKYHAQLLKVNFVQNITNPLIDYGEEGNDKDLKATRESIVKNKDLDRYFNEYEQYLYRDPVIMEIDGDSRRSVSYSLAINTLGNQGIYEDHIINSFTFEDLLEADFFKDYYDKNSAEIDSLYDKYESEIDGKNAVLVKFFKDNSKEFVDNALKEINEDPMYSTSLLRVNINKIKSKWYVEDFVIDDAVSYDEELYGSSDSDEEYQNNVNGDYQDSSEGN